MLIGNAHLIDSLVWHAIMLNKSIELFFGLSGNLIPQQYGYSEEGQSVY